MIETDMAFEFLAGFRGRAEQFLQAKNIPLQFATIRPWQSAEDSTWQQWVLEVVVWAEAKEALKVWDDLFAMLEKVTAQDTAIRDYVSLTVRGEP